MLWNQEGVVQRLVSSGLPTQTGEDVALNVLRMPEIQALVRYSLIQEGKRSLRVGDGPPASDFVDRDQPLVQTLLAVPFSSKDGSPGAFVLLEKDGKTGFSPDDERLLNLFAVFAGVLLDNIALYGAVDRERTTLNSIQNSMAEGLIVLDAEGRIVFCNPAAEELLNLGVSRVAGKQMRRLLSQQSKEFESPDQVRALAAHLRQVTDRPAHFDLAILKPRRRDLAATVFPIRTTATDRLAGVLIRDVTDERELHRRRDTFVSVASHELRTPMTTIMGFTELLLGNKATPEQHQTWLTHVYEDSRRVVDIVDDLLNVSRIESGKLTVDLEPVMLSKLTGDIAEGIQHGTEDHKIVVIMPDELPAVLADRDKLSQVVVNLLSNAVKYSPKGGPITATAHHDRESGTVVLSVADEGVGIAPEDQKRLFASFARIYRPETANVRGTGLGLYIVKGLADLMGGKVWIDSKVNAGSTFHVALPVAA